MRLRGGTEAWQGSFITYWVQRLLFWQAPDWVFALVYSLFAVLVLAVWWRYPPRRGDRKNAVQRRASSGR